MMTPRVMCAQCGHVFLAKAEHDVDQQDAEHQNTVTCPECGHQGPPGGVMQPTGFPSLETFKRSWQKARAAEAEEG